MPFYLFYCWNWLCWTRFQIICIIVSVGVQGLAILSPLFQYVSALCQRTTVLGRNHFEFGTCFLCEAIDCLKQVFRLVLFASFLDFLAYTLQVVGSVLPELRAYLSFQLPSSWPVSETHAFLFNQGKSLRLDPLFFTVRTCLRTVLSAVSVRTVFSCCHCAFASTHGPVSSQPGLHQEYLTVETGFAV